MNDVSETTYDEDGLTMVYCSHCGTKLGRLSDGSRCGLLCAQCKTEYVVTLKETSITQTYRTRGKRKQT